MKEMKRIVALVLCLVMLVGYLPVGAQADEVAPVQEPSAITDVVVEEAAAEAEENDEESLTPDTGDPAPADGEVVSEENTTSEEEAPAAGEAVEEEAPAEEEATEEAAEEATEEVTEEVTEEATEETVAFELELDAYVAPLLDAADPVVVIAGSDFQNQSGDTAGGKTVTSIINQMGYTSVDGVLFGGDYSSGMSTNTNLTNLDGYLDDYCATADNRIYIQGNHDTNLTPGSGLLDKEGSHDPTSGAYGVYAINHEDFPWSGSSSTLVQGTADLLKAYLDAKAEENYKKPIFVMSHLPLHTARGDNKYAKLIFDVVEEAGEKGLNIIFLFGHNHSGGYDAELGNGSIYLKKGDSLTVVDGSSGTYTDSSISFTYMNYGYVGYVSGSSDTTLTMTAFEITDSQVTVKRYDTEGQHNLKAAGTASEYEDVYGQAVINLSTGESTISEISADNGDDNTGSDDNSGSTGGNGNVYVLDTDGIDVGAEYLIVSAGSGIASALTNNNGSASGTEVTITDNKITLDNATNLVWVFESETTGTLTNGGNYIYLNGNSTEPIGTSNRNVTVTNNNDG